MPKPVLTMRPPVCRLATFVTAALVGASLLTTEPAQAFTYPEHLVITRRALAGLMSDAAVTKPVAQGALEALRKFVREVPDEKPGYRLDISLDGPLPEDDLNVADLVALAADHSTSPRNLLERWFWNIRRGGQCTGRNLWDGIMDLDNSAEPPEKCTRGSAAHARVDREGFVHAVRSYYDGKGSFQSTTFIDAKISEYDCAYICLAERGRTHFRIPTMSVEDASYRPDFPNGAASYAMNHAVAIGLAMRSAWPNGGGKYLGLAMLYEMFALHYLQDGVAAGHMIPLHYGYGNITVNSTHDYYNRVGVKVSIPREICARMDFLGLQLRFNRIYRQCRRPIHEESDYASSPTVRGDHALANHLDVEDDTDVTRELAEMLSLWSLREVVRAADLAEQGWLEWLALKDPEALDDFSRLMDSRLLETQELDHENLENAIVNAVFSADLDRVLLQRVLRRQREYFATKTSLDRKVFAPLGGIGMWPSLFVPRSLVEAPGGHNLYLRSLIRNSALPAHGDLIGSLGAGYAYMATLYRKRLLLDSDMFLTYTSSPVRNPAHHLGGGIRNAMSVHWAMFGGLSLFNQLGVAVEYAPRVAVVPGDERYAWQITTTLMPISYEMASDLKSFTMGAVTGLGWLGPSGASASQLFGFVGIELGATYHPKRVSYAQRAGD